MKTGLLRDYEPSDGTFWSTIGGSGNVYNGPSSSVIVLMFAADHIRSHASLNTGSDLWEHADGAKYLQHLSHFNQSKYHEYLLKDFHHCKKSTQTMCTHALEDFPQKENITMHCECNSSYLSCSADKPGGGINILFWFYRFKCCSGDTFLRILLRPDPAESCANPRGSHPTTP